MYYVGPKYKIYTIKKKHPIAVSTVGVCIIGGHGGGDHQGDGHPIGQNGQSQHCRRGLDIGDMGKTGGWVSVSFLQRWKGWGGKRTSRKDSQMSKTGLVRSMQWWVGGRGGKPGDGDVVLTHDDQGIG